MAEARSPIPPRPPTLRSGPPTATDDFAHGFAIGDTLIDTAADRGYTCVDSANDAAVWVDVSGHGPRHQNGGDDEVNVGGLSGELADPQPPKTHAPSHTDGSDDVADLVGDSGAGGTHGLVPAPASGDAAADKVLRADGSWDIPAYMNILARKGSPGTIAKGRPVYISGFNIGANVTEVEEAKADSATTMAAAGLAAEPITNSANSLVRVWGRLAGIDTSAFSVGDEVFVSAAVAGDLQNTRPTGATSRIQKVAEVLRSHATLGEVTVYGAGRTNAAPNIAQDNIFKGDANGIPQPVAFAHAADHQNGGADEVATATAAANVIPKTGGAGKLDVGFMPDAVVGGVNYQGTWNAATNTPALASGVGTKGHYYVVSTPGSTNLDGITDWKANDWAIYNGTAWEKIDNTDQVSSVFGRIGAVAASSADYTHAQIGSVGVDDHHAQDHAASHENGGGDEISVGGLSGALADAQSPSAHETSHRYTGGDSLRPDLLSANPGPPSQVLRRLASDSTLKPVFNDLAFQDPVTSILNTPPGSPSVGDRYRVDSSPTGGWIGQAGKFAEYNTALTWDFIAPSAGFTHYNVADGKTYQYTGSAWVELLGAVLIRKYTGDDTNDREIDLGDDYDYIEIFADESKTRTVDHLVRAWALLDDNYGIIAEDGAASDARSYVHSNGDSRFQGKMTGGDVNKIKLGSAGSTLNGTNASGHLYVIFGRKFSAILP